MAIPEAMKTKGKTAPLMAPNKTAIAKTAAREGKNKKHDVNSVGWGWKAGIARSPIGAPVGGGCLHSYKEPEAFCIQSE